MNDNRYVTLLSDLYSSEAAELVLRVTIGHFSTEQVETLLRAITISRTQAPV